MRQRRLDDQPQDGEEDRRIASERKTLLLATSVAFGTLLPASGRQSGRD